MPRLRVIAFGYGALALALLDTLESIGVTPVAVVLPGNRTGPDVDMVAARAWSKGWTPLVQPPRKSIGPFLETIRQLRPDLMFVWSYSMLLPPELIALAPLGAVNLHGGLLPEYRGGHVMNWAIANGERETGVTLVYLDAGIDTGPVIAERRFPIEAQDDAASVREKLKVEGQALLEQWWPAIEAGTAPRVPQDESRAHYYRMRTPEDGRIDWSQSNVVVCNLVRALASPWPGAFVMVGNTRVVLRRVEPMDAPPGPVPGTITHCDDSGVTIAAGTGAVRVLMAEAQGLPASASELRRMGLVEGSRV